MTWNYQQTNTNIYTFGKQLLPIVCCSILFFISLNSNADIQLSLQPTPIVIGEPATLTINSTDGKAHIDNLPEIENLDWIENNTKYTKSVISINGKRFEQTVYQFIVSKLGIITIPSMEIITDNDKIYTQEKKIRIVKGPLADLEKQLYIKVDYNLKDKKNIYTGEEIPLTISLYKADNLSATPLEYPKIKMNNIIFDDFSKFNPDNDRFAPYPHDTKRIKKDGINFTQTTFFTSFRSLGSGPLNGTVSLLCNIRIPQRGRSNSGRFSSSMLDNSFFNNDSFFSNSFFNRGGENLSKLLVAELPNLNIHPLPASPSNTNFLGLVGNWTLQTALSSDKIKEGEPLTLSLEVTGIGTLETLSAPELSIPGFTVYSPEIQKKGNRISISGDKNGATINYVLIPTDSGKTNIDISFSTFNPEKNQYETVDINKSIKVLPNNRSSKSFVYGNTSTLKNSTSPQKSSKHKISNAILYLIQHPGRDVLVPLWLNHIIIIIILLLLGPLLWIIVELIYFKKKRVGNSLTLQRKNNALKRKNKVIKIITKASSDNLPDIIQKEAVPYINDLKGYPPGTTADELSNKLREKELAGYLKEANALSYMPSLKKNSLSLKNNLIKALKRLSTIIIIGFVLLLSNNKTIADNKQDHTYDLTTSEHISSNESDINQLITAYNKADFNKAEKICRENIHINTPNPDWIYNLGNCYYQNGNLSDALVCYERALRLKPGNSDYLENLNFVRRKLFLPEVYQKKTPIALLQSARDSFRPDEWMLIFAAAWFIFFIALILRRFSMTKIWGTVLTTALIVAVLSLTALLSEKAKVYNPKIAMVVERNVKIHMLPSVDSSKATFILNPGDQVKIKEKINKWLRIRKGKDEGWVLQDSVAKIWPY